MTTTKPPPEQAAWYTLSAQDAADRLGVNPDQGLSADRAGRLLAEYGPHELPRAAPRGAAGVAGGRLSNPRKIRLVIVCGASFAVAQWATAVVVLGLVVFNVVMGSNQELKARASVAALAQLQVPRARVRRSGQVEELESTNLVPGDILLL